MSAKPIIFITGANTGLGYEVMRALLNTPKPYEILLGSRNISKGDEALKALKAEFPQTSSTITTIQVDIESDSSIDKAFDTISSRFGKVDILINNAGQSFDGQIQSGELSIRDAWNKSWNVNVAGTQVLTTTFVPLLLKSSDPRLMFVTSGTSSLDETDKFDTPARVRLNGSPAAGWPKEMGYSITSYRSAKTGLNMMMREWCKILKEDGVKVFCISPGFLATGLGHVGPEKLRQMGALDPSEGGNFIKDVVEGKRDQDVGKVIRASMVQPW